MASSLLLTVLARSASLLLFSDGLAAVDILKGFIFNLKKFKNLIFNFCRVR